MLASVHIVDGGLRTSVRCLRRTPTSGETPGLLDARGVVAAPLEQGPIAVPQPGRFGLVAFWEDGAALDEFVGAHPLAEVLAGGWSVRLEPVRAVPVTDGHFPGVPDDLPTAPEVAHDGPTAVLTIGQLRAVRTIRFLRTSRRAERQVADAPGVLWATGLANPARRVVSTFSLWRTGTAMRAYATSTTGHTAAMRSERRRSFHHAGSFVRFRPYGASGVLAGRNPLSDQVTAAVNRGADASVG
jgi:hypothetical protein